MQGDERCVLDTMRLIDLLLVLLFEGRNALPKSNGFSAKAGLSGLKRMDSSAERSHRHLIDCIRSKDTDALIEAIESGDCPTSAYFISEGGLWQTTGSCSNPINFCHLFTIIYRSDGNFFMIFPR